eukprot:339883-Hanusia_phi.AAC.1
MIQAKTRRSPVSQTGSPDINRQYSYYLPGCRGPGHGTVPSAWLPGQPGKECGTQVLTSAPINLPRVNEREVLEEPRCVIYFRFPCSELGNFGTEQWHSALYRDGPTVR